jgi:ATP-binding cassette, subfamily B, bacterial MsbA
VETQAAVLLFARGSKSYKKLLRRRGRRMIKSRDSMAKGTKRISRKDMAKMSFRDFLSAAKGPYVRLFSYMKPYMGRFWAGIFFGICFAASNAAMLFIFRHAGDLVFTGGKPMDAEQIKKFAQLPAMIRDMAAPGADGRSSLGFVLLICLAIPVVMALRGLFSYLNAYCVLWVSQRVLDDIRQKVYRHTLGQAMEFFNRQKAGDLVQTVFIQTRTAQQALTSIAADIVKQPVTIIGSLGVMIWIDLKFTIAALLLFPICLLPVLIVSKKVRKNAAREEDEAGQMMVLMNEAFGGIRVVKTHAREDYEADRFNSANQAMLRFVMKWRKAMEITGPAVETVASLGISLALVYAWKVRMDPGDMLALVGALVLAYPAFKSLSRIQLMMQKCLAATTKIFELLDRPSAIQDAPDAKALANVRGDILFEDVTFTYSGKNEPAVNGVSLHIPAGTTCALVGESGSGKSTLFALLQRLYEGQSGAVKIDGLDLRETTQSSLRENIATVSQDTFLFHDTIRQNIRYARLDATQEQIEHAAKMAYAHDFIQAQPQGYETVIGDKGCNLSGGQQQRLSIARALLKDAPILLLDEATSALDTESERRIQDALETLSKGRTVIAIAHRLSTILQADQIVVMDRGMIKAVGKHADLFERSPEYRRLYDLQFNSHQAAA